LYFIESVKAAEQPNGLGNGELFGELRFLKLDAELLGPAPGMNASEPMS
jgi:hypothetical protein